MKCIRSKDTVSEMLLRKALWSKGYRYRKNDKFVSGSPDIVFRRNKIAVFCDGEFWHGHNYKEDFVKTNSKFWNEKIKRNMERDLEITILLRDQGWTVLRFWEKEIINDVEGCVKIIIENIKKSEKI